MTKFLGRILPVVFALALAACGGGDEPVKATPTGPTITAHPQSASVTAGQGVSFSVSASSTQSIVYQWRRNGADIPGATGTSYAMATTAVSDNGAKFSVVATDPFGSTTSSEALLTVIAGGPTIGSQPASASIPEGSSATFQVTATGAAPLAYQWQSASPGSPAAFTDIPGANSSAYVVSNAALGASGTILRAVVSNGSGSVISAVATLTVTGRIPAVTTQPIAVSAVEGDSATFSVIASGSAPLAYQWYVDGAPINGGTGDSLLLSNVALGNDGESYTVTVSNGHGPAVTSTPALLTVLPRPVSITTQPVPAQTILEGNTVSFSVTASGSGLAFQWYRDGQSIPGANSAAYEIAGVRYEYNGSRFTVVVSGSGGQSVTSQESLLTVTQTVFAPVIQTDPAPQTILEGDEVTFSVALQSGTGTNATYQWQKQSAGGSSFADIPGATNASYSLTATFPDNGAKYRVVVNSSPTTTPATSADATLKVVQQSVSLLAGGMGGGGNIDGPGSSALFSFPTGVDVGQSGATYVADFANHTIRKILLDGTTSTVAGKAGFPGNVDATGVNAQFNIPYDVAVVPDESAVYVADYANGRVRKILPNGEVSTLVAGLSQPRGLALSGATNASNGTLYVAEYNAHRITKIDIATASVTVLAGNGSSGDLDDSNALAAQFSFPTDIAVDQGATDSDGDDILYVADSANAKIRVITRGAPDSVNTVVDDSFGMNFPSGIALKGTDLYVTDTNNHVIRKVDLLVAQSDPGYVSTVAGTFGMPGNEAGTGPAAQFFQPYGIALDPGRSRLVVSNFANNIIDQIALPSYDSSPLSGSASTRGFADGTGDLARFNYPRGLAVDSDGNSFIADSANHAIRKVTPGGVTTLVAGTVGQAGQSDGNVLTTARFNNPSGVAVDGNGVVYVADGGSSRIRRISGTTVSTIAIGGDISNPRALAVSTDGSILYVASSGKHQIISIADPGGAATVTVLAGTGTRGFGTGDVSTAQFNGPAGLALDEANQKLYVADTGNYEVRVVDLALPPSDGNFVRIVAGNHLAQGTQDGVGSSAGFDTLVGVAFDVVTGDLYVVDYNGHTLKRVTTNTGTVTTLVGNPNTVGVKLGYLDPGTQMRGLNGPTSVEVMPNSPAGKRELVVLDGTEHVVLKVTLDQ